MAAVPPLRGDLDLVEGYHSPQFAADVRLNTNESPLPPPRRWVEALAEEIGAIEFHRYPDRSARRLRAAIGELHGVDADMVFAGKGSNEVLQCLLLAFGGSGRTVATFEPTYQLHSHIARLTGATVVSAGRDEEFLVETVSARRLLAEEKPEVTFLCSPNNPTGRAEPEETVREIVDRSPGLVVVDEAYGQFASWSALELVRPGAGVVVVRTFSKTWSMAACRLGYAIAEPLVVDACERVALPYHLDSITQAAGHLALGFHAEMQRRVSLVVGERGRIVAHLAASQVDVWPSDANFILFRPRGKDALDVWNGLVDRSVLVRNCSTWPGLEGCLRVTVGTPEENSAFLASLDDVLR